MKKIISILITLILLTGCGEPTSVSDSNTTIEEEITYEDAIIKIQNGGELRVKEAIISLGKKYSVYVDDEKFAEVNGKLIHVLGDEFIMTDNDENIIMKEKQIKRWGVKLNRLAEITNPDDETVGYIGEKTSTKLFSIGYFFHFYDANKEEIGTNDQKNITLLKESTYYNTDEDVCYSVKKQIDIVDSYKITINDYDSIPIEFAIIMVCIEDSIKDAEEAKKAKKKKSNNSK